MFIQAGAQARKMAMPEPEEELEYIDPVPLEMTATTQPEEDKAPDATQYGQNHNSEEPQFEDSQVAEVPPPEDIQTPPVTRTKEIQATLEDQSKNAVYSTNISRHEELPKLRRSKRKRSMQLPEAPELNVTVDLDELSDLSEAD